MSILINVRMHRVGWKTWRTRINTQFRGKAANASLGLHKKVRRIRCDSLEIDFPQVG